MVGSVVSLDSYEERLTIKVEESIDGLHGSDKDSINGNIGGFKHSLETSNEGVIVSKLGLEGKPSLEEKQWTSLWKVTYVGFLGQ